MRVPYYGLYTFTKVATYILFGPMMRQQSPKWVASLANVHMDVWAGFHRISKNGLVEFSVGKLFSKSDLCALRGACYSYHNTFLVSTKKVKGVVAPL